MTNREALQELEDLWNRECLIEYESVEHLGDGLIEIFVVSGKHTTLGSVLLKLDLDVEVPANE